MSWDYHCFDVVVICKLFQFLEGGHQGGVTPVWVYSFCSPQSWGQPFIPEMLHYLAVFVRQKVYRVLYCLCGDGWAYILVLISVAICVLSRAFGPWWRGHSIEA